MSDTTELRILVSKSAAERYGEAIARCLPGRAFRLVHEGDAEVGFVTRDVTGLSTKHTVLPQTQVFYDALLAAPSMRWVQAHSAGADRPIFLRLREKGVMVATASGSNAEIVAHTALAGLLALTRRFPQLMAAQREHRWASLIGGELPRDLNGQRATVVGWGPVGQHIARLVAAFGLKVSVVRSSAEPVAADIPTVPFEELPSLLPTTDWLMLACPLSDRTRQLLDARALALLPRAAHLVNVARGEVVDEPALIDALREGRLAGAFLDVYSQEPLPEDSPLWDMPNVIATPHSAGFSDANAARVAEIFFENLRRWNRGEPPLRQAA